MRAAFGIHVCFLLPLWLQLEASAELEDFIALFQSGCSGAVVHFFCSFYFPFCASTSPEELLVLPPCRGFCQHVRDRCEPVFSRYQGVSWPEFLNCSAFPEIAENGPCFTPPDPSEVTVPPIVFSFDVILPTLVVEPPTTPQATPTAVATTTQTLTPTPPPACQRVDTKYCPSAIGYTDTRFPTSRGQQTQLQAETELASYETLIRTECSGAIVHFLCSYFFPECVNGVVLEPCRELCLHVRPGCRAAVQQLNSTWTAEFACESLPSRTGGSCSGPANPAAVSVPVIPGVTDRGDATVPLTLTTLLLVCLAAVYCGGF